ncbi:MAG: NAD(+) synthase [Thermoanaerobaculia bacterium]
MKLLRVAGAVLNQTPLDWDGNARRLVAALEAARAQGASIVCLPELALSGYGCEDAFLSPGTIRTAAQMLERVLPATRGLIASLGLPIFHSKALYNATCIAVDGRPAGLVAKQFLPGDGVHYEPRWFKPWPAGLVASWQLGGQELPLGDLLFDCGGVRLGVEICEDAWVADRRGRGLALEAVDVILNPSASHFAFGKRDARRGLVVEASRAFGVTYVYSNLVGNEAGRIIYDGGVLIGHAGELVAAGPRLSFHEVGVVSAVVDVSAARLTQVRSSGFTPRLDVQPIAVPFAFPALEPEAPPPAPPAWEEAADLKREEFTRAVALGLFDYLRKSGAQGFVVSLSGGADSTAVAVLVAKMVELAADELGLETLIQRLGHAPVLAGAGSVRELVGRLLVCVYQPTRNSSTASREAAHGVAHAVGATYRELDVDELVEGYRRRVEQAEGRSLGWETDDLALQNVQARARGPGAWLLANLRDSLLLATSDRSEAAVGYATMDGDTCGGLAPIAGIDKAFLRQWLRAMQDEIPVLAAVNRQEPTPELRPPAAHQTAEGDLMPYDLLEAIEDAAIRDKHTPLETFRELRVRYPQHAAGDLALWIDRFFRRWCHNQWKRERYAPSFHLDDKNLDPRSWCRFPILSGGFERELAELRAYLAEATTPTP